MDEQRQPPEIQCLGLSVGFGDADVVMDRVDLTARAGQITTLLGPSGAGKSTLVKHILGLLEPEAGTVRIGDCDVWASSPQQLLRVRKNLSALHSGSTLYDGSIFASMSVRENLLTVLFEAYVNPLGKEGKAQPVRVPNPYQALGGPRRRVTQVDGVMQERAQECLERFDLTQVADMLPGDLAAGTRRRAALARALIVEVPLYILDDFDGALDVLNRDWIIDAVMDTHRRTGATMLIITHDLSLAAAISDQVAMLASGRIVVDGDPELILQSAKDWYTVGEKRP